MSTKKSTSNTPAKSSQTAGNPPTRTPAPPPTNQPSSSGNQNPQGGTSALAATLAAFPPAPKRVFSSPNVASTPRQQPQAPVVNVKRHSNPLDSRNPPKKTPR